MFLEELSVGQRFETGPREITQEDVLRFADLTHDRNPVHLDPAFAATTPYGRTIAHGMLTLSLALGLWSSQGLTRESLVALVSLDDVRFLKPVFPGEFLRLVSEVVEVRESRSRPGTGFVTYHERVLNNSQEEVVEYRRTVLLKKRPTLAPPTREKDAGRA